MNDRNRAGEVQIAWQLLTDAMLMETAVHPVNKLVNARGNIGVPANAGVYAFWWVGNRDQLMQANREIVLRGHLSSFSHEQASGSPNAPHEPW